MRKSVKLLTVSKKSAIALLMLLIFASIPQGSIHTASAQLENSQFTLSQDWNVQAIEPGGRARQLVLDSQNNPHILYYVSEFYKRLDSGLNYAKCVNGTWETSFVSKKATNSFLFLDSADNPQILYQIGDPVFGYTTMLATLNGTDWISKSLGLQDTGSRYLAAEYNGKLYFVFSKLSYPNIHTLPTRTTWYYAAQNDSGWTYQKIDEELRNYTSIGSTLSSFIIDSEGIPHVVYGDYVEHQFPIKNSTAYGVYDTYDVKYATLENGTWTIQTAVKNATGYTSNLALNSNGQPSFCYAQEYNFTYYEQYGSSRITQTLNYAYWDGLNWTNEQIDRSTPDFGRLRLRIDIDGNPQAFYHRENYKNQNETGIVYAIKTGSNWTTWLIDQSDYRDLEIDSAGNLHIIFDYLRGYYSQAMAFCNLTYATLSSSYLPTPPSPPPTVPHNTPLLNWVVIVTLILSAFCVAVLLRHQKNSTKSSKGVWTSPVRTTTPALTLQVNCFLRRRVFRWRADCLGDGGI